MITKLAHLMALVRKRGLKILQTAKAVLVEYCTVEAYEGQELYMALS